jgi:cytochrome b561
MNQTFNMPSKLLHWLSALVIFGLLAIGLYMADLPKGPDKLELVNLHKSFGLLALLLLIIRIPVRIKNPVEPLASISRKDHIKAKAVQGLIYLLLAIMPLSGIFMTWTGGYGVSFFGLEVLPSLMEKNHDLHELLEEVHEFAAWALMALLVAHIGAALYHHFIVKDETLKRMSLK